jgi:hypothetical protein
MVIGRAKRLRNEGLRLFPRNIYWKCKEKELSSLVHMVTPIVTF